MRALITDPTVAARLRLAEVAQPDPARDQALIQVEAFSLNTGEVRAALAAAGSYVPGWDFAGTVAKAAVDGSTPPEGARVFGFVPQGSWAEYLVAQAPMMGEIPGRVSSAQAAALPVAGVTALRGLESAGPLLGRTVLVTGAAGGVGRFACQLANLAGADVFAVSRRAALPDQLRADGVPSAGVFTTIAAAKEAGRYDLILDGVGGESLASAMSALAPGGLCVSYGNGSGQPASFDPGDFYHTAGARLQGVWLGNLMAAGDSCTRVLSWLARLVALGRLHPPIDTVLPWTSAAEAAKRQARGEVNGKIIVTVG
jgi:NADPH:quinone reductase